MAELKAPFPWFGGKSRIASEVWRRFGPVPNYVEPFFGSGAMLLGRPDFDPDDPPLETVNDLDGFVSNFWRAVQADPDAVAKAAIWPVNENDLHARHTWLVGQKESMQARLEGDPAWFDARTAGWWCWGLACWIGGGFCDGSGPWHVVDGRLVNTGTKGQGVNRQLVHLGNKGRGVNRKRGEDGGVYGWMQALAERLARVRVCCGDWGRVCGETPTVRRGLTGVFLDPPYSAEAGRAEVYAKEDLTVAHAIREWALANGDNPLMRIALCGYEGEHAMPDTWEVLAWKAAGGYGGKALGEGRGKVNSHRERVWFSPSCLRPGNLGPLFDLATATDAGEEE